MVIAHKRHAHKRHAHKCLDLESKNRTLPRSSAPAQAKVRQRLSPLDRERQIVAGAIDFFSRRGLDAQIRDLAKEVGIAHTLLYHYFPTKQALIDRVYEELFVGRWDPNWEVLLDSPLALEEKLCSLYESYLSVILTPEWIRIIVGSGLSDGAIPQRYFQLMQERFFPRVVRETRKAFGNRSRAKAGVREQALLMGLHGGLIYSLGIWPHVYGQKIEGVDSSKPLGLRVRNLIIRDRVQSYLLQAQSIFSGPVFSGPVSSGAISSDAMLGHPSKPKLGLKPLRKAA
jgi:AcrR family transcriptional regulator